MQVHLKTYKNAHPYARHIRTINELLCCLIIRACDGKTSSSNNVAVALKYWPKPNNFYTHTHDVLCNSYTRKNRI